MRRRDLLRSSTRALAAKAAARIEQRLGNESADRERAGADAAAASNDAFPTARCSNPECSHSWPVVAEAMYGVVIGRTRCGGCGAPLSWPNTPIPVRTLNQFVVLTPIEDWSGRFYDSYQREQQREQEGRQRLADELVAGSNPMSEAGKRTATPGAGAALRPLLLERLRDDLAIIRDLRIQRDAPRATATPALSDAEVEARIKEALARADAVTRSIDDICLQRRPLCDPYASAARRTAVWRDARDGLLLCGAALARLPDRDAHRLSVEPLFDELFAIQHDMGATPGTPDEIYGVARRLLRVYQSMNADEGAVGYEDARTGISRIGNVLALMAGRSISVSATNDRAGTPAARHGVAIPDVIGWLNHAIGFGNKIKINGKNYYGPDTDPVIQQAKGFHLVQIGTEWGNPVYKRCYCDGSICGTVPNGKRGRRQEAGDGSDARRSPSPGPIDQLKELGRLHGQGLITDEEFAAKKAEILDR